MHEEKLTRGTFPGEHGGVVIRRFSGDGRTWVPGQRVPASVTKKWNVNARFGLSGTYVDFFRTPQPDESRAFRDWMKDNPDS